MTDWAGREAMAWLRRGKSKRWVLGERYGREEVGIERWWKRDGWFAGDGYSVS